MLVVQAVLETYPRGGFTCWPVADSPPDGFLPLDGSSSPAEVGTAVLRVADCNDIDPGADGRPPACADPVGAVLHGLLTADPLYAPGGLWFTDTATGTTLVPGCCEGMDDRHGWWDVADRGGRAVFGHDPSPCAERHGGLVRLTVDAERDDSPVIELSVTELRRLLSGAERDLRNFLSLAADWAARHLPGRADAVTSALGRALDCGRSPRGA
ncbi:MAG TPA: hypothetical protein VFP69_17615 [Streptomyces sp.]|nr:hypothetical protein [Streptomyces sp.]